MEHKIKIIIKTIFIFFIVIVFCCGILYLFDYVFEGFSADWFVNNFVDSYAIPSLENEGQFIQVQSLIWSSLKQFIIFAAVLTALLWTATILLAVYFSGKRSEKRTIAKTGELIRQCMEQERPVSDIFPNDYVVVSSQIAEIKTEMLRKEQILKEEAARKSDLITYLAHDLKTPLTSVIGYLSLLDEASDMPAKQKAKYIHISLEKALRLEKLINEFFEITRYNLQQIHVEKEEIDLSYMLTQMTDEFYPILQQHHNTIEVQVDEDLLVYADPEKLARVFNNILKNAIAYSYPDTPIRIWEESTENEARIYFRNKGRTIPKQKLESIFEKFFRLDESRASNTGGAGLGLAIAREILALHGGTITATSENELTTFIVTLPYKVF